MKATGSREELIGCSDDVRAQSHESLRAPQDTPLTATEKKFLLTAERGDCATVRRLLREYRGRSEELDINCVDPLNRSALIAAIENENIDLIRLLLEEGIRVKDALLHAIKEEYVEAVEILLEWEERNHMPGQPYSWEAVDRATATFTPDITPLILAAHMNNYEILKILLDRGASLPVPHDVRCGCDECVASSDADSLRHSQARINAYRALTAPSLIALSSRDPLLTAFELSRELRRLSHMENEFHDQYVEMSARCQDFATSLLDHVRTSLELEVLLNHCPDGDPWQPGERQTLERLKLAIKYKQKKFVAHHNVQQLLAAIWYEGLPGFRRKGMAKQLFEVAKLGSMFPVYSAIYMFAPNSRMGQFMKKPFVKFIIHSSSYAFFLTLLAAASQRVEVLLLEWMGARWMRRLLEEWHRKERGSLPGPVEFCVMGYILSLMWCEIRALWKDGLLEYITDLWNIVDFITNCFYMIWICLRLTSWYIVQREAASGLNPWYPRERWHPFDPMLLSEGAFAAGMIFSFLKLVHIFSVNPHLGPLQISLGRMIIDILKFFFIYSLVLFAFGCGMNQLLWYYADLERSKCYHLPTGLPDYDHEDKACSIWRRFSNLFETSQSLFWASFGLVDLANFELTGIKSFTRFWALLMFGSYSVINIIVLLNMLIAMMSNSYQIISERADTEWKFARSHLWMSYFEEGDTVPPPFNIIPTSKGVASLLGCRQRSTDPSPTQDAERGQAQERHDTVMHLLVRRYVTAEQRKRDEFGISEDDVMEIRQDISSLRYEIIDILRTNGMRTPNIDPQDTQVPGKKGRVMERRLLKDFQIGFVEGVVNEAVSNLREPKDVFSKIARAIGRRGGSGRGSGGAGAKKKDWNALVRRSTMVRDPIGSTSEARSRHSRQSIRRYILDNKPSQLDPDRLVEYNPRLSDVLPAARVAYATFKKAKIQKEFDQREERQSCCSSESLDADGGSTAGADDVFEGEDTPTPTPGAPAPAPPPPAAPAASSIARPRPRSALKSPAPAPALAAPAHKDFRSPTPIEEDPREALRSPTPAPEPQPPGPQAPASPPSAASPSSPASPATPASSKTASPTPAAVHSRPQTPAASRPTSPPCPPCPPQADHPPSPRRAGVTKAAGKSKVSGQTLTGWL
ncbi:hypothetical protein R5R35_004107 [Gryllus longicercus]|uniref:Transient receptor ion channel domain-containing protein n=1 Tax=Gryllus longicercus TaxID=2509291 RepID=A0AAN9Z4G6_9ORTH